MNVRVALPADAADFVPLNREFNDQPKVTVEQAAAHLAAGSDVETVLVAEVDVRVVGFACLQMRRSICYHQVWAEITELYVQEAYRRRGVGRKLMELAEQHARKRGACQTTLLVNRHNEPAQALYRHLGYRPKGDLVMVKSLAD
jgi:ribosomal protein S18 acetylase RimI-like enzyme